MKEEEAINIYNSLARPPKDALREIQAGKLKGKTDINPQWRYKTMTEKFGLVGLGWKYEVRRLWTEAGAGAERLAFAEVAVYVKDGETWSEPIVGIGGSKLVQIEKGAAISNDEGYKMAVTDAFSTALKMLGVAADIYAGKWDGSKYKAIPQQARSEARPEQKKPEVKPEQKKTAAKFAFEPKGGETTPEEKHEMGNLLKSKYPDGSPVFTKEDALQYSGMRKDFTAREVIDQVKKDLQAKLSPTSGMKTAGDMMREAEAIPGPVEAAAQALGGEVIPPADIADDLY